MEERQQFCALGHLSRPNPDSVACAMKKRSEVLALPKPHGTFQKFSELRKSKRVLRRHLTEDLAIISTRLPYSDETARLLGDRLNMTPFGSKWTPLMSDLLAGDLPEIQSENGTSLMNSNLVVELLRQLVFSFCRRKHETAGKSFEKDSSLHATKVADIADIRFLTH